MWMKSLGTLILLCVWIASLTAQALDYRQGELIICLHPGTQIDRVLADYQLVNGKRSKMEIARCLSPTGNIWKITFDHNTLDHHKLIHALKEGPLVQVVQLNHFVKKRSRLPNDPFLDRQWQWFNVGARNPMDLSNLAKAWDITTGGLTATGDTIVVASIDVGVNYMHHDLSANIWYNTHEVPGNRIDDDNNGYIDDYRGWNLLFENDNIEPELFAGNIPEEHGTEILGTIGARGNNGSGVTGINWTVKMMNVYFNRDLNEADMIGAYGYILEQRKLYNETQGQRGAFVVATNLSWGDEDLTPDETPIWCTIYDMLGEVGILNAAATANDLLDIDDIKDVPTSCPSEYLISVTATDVDDQRTFAAYGKNDIDLAAPGQLIYTTKVNEYGFATGTSYASSIVAGSIALLYSTPCSDLANIAMTNPSDAALIARDLILDHVDTLSALSEDVKTGGRLNVFKSLSATLEECNACIAPFDVVATVELDSVILTWSLSDSVTTTSLEFRTFGDTVWSEIDSVTSPYKFTDLEECTAFELRLTGTCIDGSNATSNPTIFTTLLCCDPPQNAVVTGGDGSIVVSWEAVLGAEAYELRFAPIDSVTWDTVTNITATTLTLDSLLPCTNYGIQLRTICTGNMKEFGDTLTFLTNGCGPCLDTTYCELDIQPFGAEWIDRFSLLEIDNASGYNEGYGDFTGSIHTTTLKTDNAYELTFWPGFANDSLAEHYFAWIDYNQNGDFDDEGEMVFSTEEATADSMVVGKFKVPSTAAEGVTRLRIMMLFEPIDTVRGCGTVVDLGEAEDYCVNIVFDSLLCPQPTGIDTMNFAGTSTDIVWERVDSAIAYTIRYRKVGDDEWEEMADTATHYNLAELEECSDYEVQVQAVCKQDTSGYTESFVFSTFCSTSTDEELVALSDFQVFPNPFSNQITMQWKSDLSLPARVILRSLDGKQILDRRVHLSSGGHGTTFYNLGNLTPGVYLLALESTQGQVVRKLIKQ